MDSVDAWLWPLLHAHAPLRPVPLCPSLRAFDAVDEMPLWEAVEAAAGHAVGAPFYAVAWPGAQALARAVLDGVVEVKGARVLDLGCGSGLSAVAAACRGAAHVVAADVDPLALSTCRALAEAHCVEVHTVLAGLPVGLPAGPETPELEAALVGSRLFDAVDVVLIGDLVYERALADALRGTLDVLARRHPETRVLVADSGRPFFAARVARPLGLRRLAEHTVPVRPSVDGCETRTASVYAPGPVAGGARGYSASQ